MSKSHALVRQSDSSSGDKPDETPALSPNQLGAIELLLEGKSITHAARELNVSRMTVFRWMKHDTAFRAAYNQWQEALEESSRSRLTVLSDKATDAIERALDAGDARSALAVLKGLGVLRPSGPRLTDPAELEAQDEVERRRRQIEREEELCSMRTKETNIIREDLIRLPF